MVTARLQHDLVPRKLSAAFAHTVVPTVLGGRGVGTALVRHVLDYAAQHGYRVNPQCSFVKAYIDRHPDYQPLSLAQRQDG